MFVLPTAAEVAAVVDVELVELDEAPATVELLDVLPVPGIL